METVIYILLGILGLLILGILGVSVGLSFYISLPKNDLEKSKQWETDHNFYRDFDTREVTEYTLTSFDGYILHAIFVPNRDFPDSRKFIIISHGYTSSHYGALKYLNKWMELGFQCVLYDDRYHGANLKSWRKCSTLGINESKDLMTVIEDTYKRYGEDIYLGLQGESMGSGLEITALKYKPKVHFIVNDCGFADLKNVLEGCCNNWFHLPKWLAVPSSYVCKLIFGWNCLESRPIDSLKDNTVPICFVHGTADTLIPYENSERMAAANPAYSEVHLFEGAKHADCMSKDEPRYLEIMKNFLKKVEEIEAGSAE